ncbi:MAG: non-canonical purine NTP pyrophosphatase, partial [Patescibacteria group bacterium]|nr:non-canonical purine NTP pyrophosphatase [Patescibacteria group bacterium]
RDVGITDEVEETGITYEENSRLKAITYAKLSGLPAVSDDGGLEIAALNGEPGVNSRYWAGLQGRDEDIIEKMITVAKELPDNNRQATFRTVITLALPDGQYWQVEGHIDGVIAKEPLLNILHGYPYRSFFYLPSIKKYYHESELTEQEEKEYNHRWKAVSKLKPLIKTHLGLV